MYVDSSFRASNPSSINMSEDDGQPVDGTFGIDKLAIWYPLHAISDFGQVSAHRRERSVADLGYSLRVRCTSGDTRAAMLRAEFNPSRMLDADGSSLASAADAVACAEVVRYHLQCLGFHPADSLDRTTIVRLDLTRDFLVSDPQVWISTLAPHRVKQVRAQSLYLAKGGRHTKQGSAAYGGIQARTSNATFSLYDKRAVHTAEDWSATPSLRFEASLRSGALKHVGLRQVADLSPSRALRVGMHLWKRTGWADVRTPLLVADVIAATKHDGFTKTAMLGAYEATLRGSNFGLQKNHPVNQALRGCGLQTQRCSPKVPLSTSRLDWTSGLEMQ